MRSLLACLLLVFPLIGLSAEISCFSGKTRIYHGFVHGIVTNDEGLVLFREDKTNDLIMISADCVVYQPAEYKKLYDDVLKQKKK